MPEDYLPRPDAELVAWTTAFMTYANPNAAALGITDGDLDTITDAQTLFGTRFAANNAAQNAAKNAVQAKDAARAALETALRSIVRAIQGNPNVTNAQRQSLGISLRGGDRTPVVAPTTRPVLEVDISQRLQHSVSFSDQLTPNTKAKPQGVNGCEIWVKVGGTLPANESEMRFLAVDTRTPYVAHYDMADAGKTAYYFGRWTNTKGEPGPWSEIAIATIGG